MKDWHLPEAEMNDLVEGLLDGMAGRRAEEHLQVCAECRAEVESLRSLLAGMRELPREIRPRRDLFPEIARAVQHPGIVPLHRPGRRAGRRTLAAAAVVLVALTAAVGVWLFDRQPEEPVAVIPPPAELATTGLTEVATDYEAAIRELSITLEERRSEIDPATIRLVEENLRLIDRAIRESRAALGADPANQVLEQLVVSGYEQKLDILRRAARSTES
ncbi:MAG: hypothetical protein ACREK5_08670 [Gemmatimonadota bacterium]